MAKPLRAKWVEIENLYLAGQLTVAEIAKQFGVNRNTICRRKKKCNWPNRSQLRPDAAVAERAILRRIIAKKLEHLEKRMDDPETVSDADSERQVRAVASLMNSVVKLDANEEAWRERIMAAPSGPAAGAANYGDDDVADWRQDLAERIAKLVAERMQ